MKRIICLDFDGVLRTWHRSRGPGLTFHPPAVQALNWLTDQTQAELVITSSWRESLSLPELVAMLRAAGVTGRVAGQTPRLKGEGCGRTDEILQYLAEAGVTDLASIVLLDDEPTEPELEARQVLVADQVGLTMSNARTAAALLSISYEPTSL